MGEYREFTADYTILGDTFSVTWNDFCRTENPNTIIFATEALPAYVDAVQPTQPLNIADVGCSQGMETWLLAATVTAQEIDAQFTGIDVNPVVLGWATEPYACTMEKLTEKLAEKRWPPACLEFFEPVDEAHIQPVEKLRERVTFCVQDIRTEPLPADTHHAILSNNAIGWYELPEKSHILRNIAGGIKPGGIFSTCDAVTLPERLYRRFGLVVADDLPIPRLFRKQS
jgi:chemotaxis methyl-accepting protein methylase